MWSVAGYHRPCRCGDYHGVTAHPYNSGRSCGFGAMLIVIYRSCLWPDEVQSVDFGVLEDLDIKIKLAEVAMPIFAMA